jgi:hypothetical protein
MDADLAWLCGLATVMFLAAFLAGVAPLAFTVRPPSCRAVRPSAQPTSLEHTNR